MAKSNVFKTSKGQTIRLPKSVAFPESVRRVEIERRGEALFITPAGASWDNFFDGPTVSEDFAKNRNQPVLRIGFGTAKQ
jgi:antitoxin VapB